MSKAEYKLISTGIHLALVNKTFPTLSLNPSERKLPMSNNNHIQIYALGGTGAVYSSPLYKLNKESAKDPLAPQIKIAFIDAGSGSYDGVHESDYYCIKKFDETGKLVKTNGSGQFRGENYQAAVTSTPDIMLKFPPGALNIVVHSAGGGSGSAIALPIVDHLLENKHLTLVYTPASTNTVRLAKNSRDTLQSFVNFVDEKQFPLAIRTFINSEEGFGRNEKNFIDTVYGLSGLFAQDLKHLDPADVRSFFDYTKLLKMEPQLLSFVGPEQNSQIDVGDGYAVTALSLFRDKRSWLPECSLRDKAKKIITPMFHKTGHYDVEIGVEETKDAHFVLVDGLVNDVMIKLNEAITSIERANSAAMVPRIKPKPMGGSSAVFS